MKEELETELYKLIGEHDQMSQDLENLEARITQVVDEIENLEK